MLFLPESLRAQISGIARKAVQGDMTFEAAAREMLTLHSGHGPAFLLLAQARAEAGDLDEAEALYWRALELDPCRCTSYLALAELLRRPAPDSLLAGGLFQLALWKLSFLEKIDSEVSQAFSKAEGGGLDFTDPETFLLLATSAEIQFKRVETPEVHDRLLPYWLLNDLQRQADSVVDVDLLQQIADNAARCVPVWRGALQSWAQSHAEISAPALQMILAILGEIGGPETLDNLLELVTNSDQAIFLHSNWAVWRLAQRFPAEALSTFRAAVREAKMQRLCAIADHLSLMPETDGLASALVELLLPFRELRNDQDAPYLLAAVVDALEGLGDEAGANRVFDQYHVMLPNKGIKKLSRLLDHPDGFLPKLAQFEIDGLTIEDICIERTLLPKDEDEAYDEDAGNPLPPPVKLGRNDPCWCGSGKKYKKCHLAADEEPHRPSEEQEAEPPAGNPLFASLYREVMESSEQWHTRHDFERATRLYFDCAPQETDPDDAQMPGFFDWYLFDYRSPATTRTSIEEYLRRRGGALPERKRALLESWRAARVRLCEVQRIELEKGIEVEDLFSGDQFFVHDVSSSRALVRFDAVLSRPMQLEGRWEFTGNGVTIPRTILHRFVERIRAESRERGQSPADYLAANSHQWHRIVTEMSRENRRDLRVVNAEGDELEFSSATYEVTDEPAAVSAIRTVQFFEDVTSERDEAGVHRFGWLETGTDGPRRSYGHIKIHEGKLRLECDSRKRLALGRQLLEKHAGAWLRHNGDSFQTLEVAKAAAAGGGRRQQTSGFPPEVEREIVLKLKTEHYSTWPDEHLPALNGRTPREAVRSEVGRRAVEQLLRDCENSEEREKRAGRAAFDFGPIRKTLGL